MADNLTLIAKDFSCKGVDSCGHYLVNGEIEMPIFLQLYDMKKIKVACGFCRDNKCLSPNNTDKKGICAYTRNPL